MLAFVRMRAPVLATVFMLLTSAGALAQSGPGIVDPFEVHSPNSACSLFVDPTSSWGDGPAHYRLSQGAEVRWIKELPVTLRELQLGDDGEFAGTADMGEGGLRLMVVGADGVVRFDTSLEYEGAWQHGPSFPLSPGTIDDSEHDRVVFRIEHLEGGQTFEEWRVVRRSTGEPLSKLRPTPPFESAVAYCALVSVKPIHGVPLVACAWSVLSSRGSPADRSMGARFEVVDQDGHVVWSLALPHDYEAGGDEWASDRVMTSVRQYGAVRECRSPRRFDAWFAAEKQRVTFEVTADAAAETGWSVREVARDSHWIENEPSHTLDPATAIKLGDLSIALLGTIELDEYKAKPIEFSSFDMDDRGRFGHVVHEHEKPARFALQDTHGALVANWPLELDAPEGTLGPTVIWLRGDRWLVHTATYGTYPHALAWWLDVSTGALTAISDFDCAPIAKVDGTPEGGFVVLTVSSTTHASGGGLRLFDAEGKLRWRRPSSFGEPDSSLMNSEDLCVSPRSEIGVLAGSPHGIRRFDMQGEFIGVIELDKLLDHPLRDPTDLGVTSDGDWIVHDFNGWPPVRRISHEGAAASTFAPRLADGSAIMPRAGLHVAPDGRMWVTDGFAFLRLDETGAVDLVVGEAPNIATLGDVEYSFVDPAGRIFLADSRTHVVHVFDREGRRIARCNVSPKRTTVTMAVDGISVSADGNIQVAVTDYDTTSYTVFDSSGARIGSESLKGHILFQPGRTLHWVVRGDEIDLVDAAGALKKRLTRGFDNKWFDRLGEASIASDGSLAVISRQRLHVFSASGDPLMSLEAPGITGWASSAFADSRVFLAERRELWCFDLASHVARKATLGKELSEGASMRPAWRADTNELWILDEQAKKVLRYRVGE